MFTEQFEFIKKQPYFKQWLANLSYSTHGPSHNASSIIGAFMWTYTKEGYGFWYKLSRIENLSVPMFTTRIKIRDAAEAYFLNDYPEYFI